MPTKAYSKQINVGGHPKFLLIRWKNRMKIDYSSPLLQLQSQAMLAARLFALNTPSATLTGAVERANTTKTATIKG